jgi:exosortase/archaeosortase family protein
MTATTDKLTIPRRGLVAALQHSLPRNELFAGLYILGCTNGLLGRIIQSAQFDGWIGAILGVDTNVIVLFAAFASISAMLGEGAAQPGEKRDEIRAADLAVAIIFLGLVSLPIFPLSWLAVTGLSFYILLFANGRSERRRGAVILLALTVPMLWSRLLFQFFAKPILNIDASLVAWLLGTERIGNMVRFADDSGYMVVLAPCSSLANMSMAFLTFVSITQWAKHRWSAWDLLWSGLACVSVIAVNVTRITLMGVSHSHYEAIHSQWGDLVTSTVMLCLMIGISVIAARRELFPRAAA